MDDLSTFVKSEICHVWVALCLDVFCVICLSSCQLLLDCWSSIVEA
jgi:hypothetical protein